MKQALRYNNKVVKKIYQGDELVKKMNYGQSSDIFQYIKNDGDTPTPPAPVPYDEQYLTIETLTSGDLSLADARSNVFNYSLDNGSTWNNLTTGQTVAVEANKKVLFKAQGLTASTIDGIGTIKYSGNFNAYGNVMSLVYDDNFIGQKTMSNFQFINLFRGCTGLTSAENLVLPATRLTNYCYAHMFRNCTNLTAAPELPATTLAEDCYYYMFASCTSLTTAPELPATRLASYCYMNMFYGCTSLTTAPELSARTLARSCYNGMFQYCTSLTTAPELPATTLINGCYYSMFQGCTSLTTAPVLPTLTLTEYCYFWMFNGCTSLNSIKCLATNISATDCTFSWVKGVAASGTFIKKASMTNWTTGTSGIPNGWTIQNDDGSPVISSKKYTATYTDDTVVTASCGDSGDVLIRNEISKTNLKTVVLGECVTRISGECFSDCSKLESVTIEGNTQIDAYSFARNNGTLKTITMKATTPPQCDSTAFTYYKSGSGYIPMESIRIYVPSASLNAYKAASGWSRYSSKIYGY